MDGLASKLDSNVNIRELAANATDYAITSGMVVVKQNEDNNKKICSNPSFMLLPSPFPSEAFNLLRELQPHINQLVHRVSRDFDFVASALESVIETDEFMKNLFEIYRKVQNDKTKSNVELGIFRADYQLQCKTDASGNQIYSPKQIEINTIAAALASIASDKVTSLHSKVLEEANLGSYKSSLPPNHARKGCARGLVAAWEAYGKPGAIVVFLVFESETYMFDQRALEYEVYKENKNIVVKRKTFEDVIKGIKVLEDGTLLIDNEEVAVVYFRIGYIPDHYKSKQHWKMRFEVERSRAVKCPSVAHQLVGCKKMQEVLARPGMVERFIPDREVAAKIRSTFAGLYSLEMTQEGDEAVQMALSDPENFVLKPQREGGGNNLFGEKLVKELREVGSDKRRSAYILMEKIRTKPVANYLVSSGGDDVTIVNAVQELGIFGVCLTRDNSLVENYTPGHIVRSKLQGANETRVRMQMAGFDSLLLV